MMRLHPQHTRVMIHHEFGASLMMMGTAADR